MLALRRDHGKCEILLPVLRQSGKRRLFPSRKRLARQCKHCGTPLLSRRTTCDACNHSSVDWQAVPLHALKTRALQQYAAQIRSLARVAYRKSSQPEACAVCGYTAHYEVCHIKPISEFLPTNFVAEVNELHNLVALCPNHHWEFDHGKLPADSIARLVEAGHTAVQ